jgi:hypothetical protein
MSETKHNTPQVTDSPSDGWLTAIHFSPVGLLLNRRRKESMENERHLLFLA